MSKPEHPSLKSKPQKHPSLTEKVKMTQEHFLEARDKLNKSVEVLEQNKNFPIAIVNVEQFQSAIREYGSSFLGYLKTEKLANVQEIKEIVEQVDGDIARIWAVLEKIGQNAEIEREVLTKLNKVLP
jgi:hypothetical protein